MDVTVIIILDTRRAKAELKYPIKLRVTFNREQKYYPLGINLKKEEFENIYSKKTIKRLMEYKIKLTEYEARANRGIQKMPKFSLQLNPVKDPESVSLV